MTLGIAHLIGILLVLALIVGIGIYSGRKVTDASDFTSGGGKAGPLTIRKHTGFTVLKASTCAESVPAGLSVQHIVSTSGPDRN